MREIKFRAWIIEAQIMVDVEYICFSEPEYSDEEYRGGYIVHTDISGPTPITALEPNEPICVTPLKNCKLMQFTGLHDKDGKEGYYKDITYDEELGEIHIIEWDDEEALFYLKGFGGNCLGTKADDLQLSALKERQIIGNIYENPELLEPTV